MRRIQGIDAVTIQPAMPALSGNVGFFYNGNAATDQDATEVPDWWLNMMQESLADFLTAAGLPLDGSASVLQAARLLFGLGTPTYITGSSALLSPASGLVKVRLAGAGGGSGAAAGGGAGGGGGGGAYAEALLAVPPNTEIAVTVGVGGTPGVTTGTGQGGPGGTSSFGSYLSATGGQAGLGMTEFPFGGSGGVASGPANALLVPGGYGGDGCPNGQTYGGNGAASAFGGGGRAAIGGNAPQQDGQAYGSGAGGSYGWSSGDGYGGGTGAPGIVIVEV